MKQFQLPLFKTCGRCKNEKPLTDFNNAAYSPDKKQHKCRECERTYLALRLEDPEFKRILKQKSRAHTKRKRSAETPEQREIRIKRGRIWYQENKQSQSEYRKKYTKEHPEVFRKQTPQYIIARRCRARVRAALVHRKKYLKKHTKELLGIESWTEGKQFIEAKFLPGMNWNNAHLWHLDHTKPCDSFDLTDERQLLECFNIKNLQPLWATINCQKHNREDFDLQAALKNFKIPESTTPS